MSPNVSIIVPIYNSASYLERAVCSLQEQTLRNIEIILINDGSSDRSLDICRSIEKHDSRVVVIDKENKGVSSARNAGLMVASGEYIGFVDSDDWVQPNMFESTYNLATQYGADIVMCNFVVETLRSSSVTALDIGLDVLSRDEIINILIPDMIANKSLNRQSAPIMGSVWRMLFNRQLLKENDIRFQEDVPLMEDLLFSIKALLRCRRLAVDSTPHYHYVNRSDSAVTKYREDMKTLLMTVFEHLQGLLISEEVYTSAIQERMDNRYINMFHWLLINEAHPNNKSSIRQKLLTIEEYCRDEQLKRLLSGLDEDKIGPRTRIIKTLLEREWALSLYLLYRVYVTRLALKALA